jgi:hypothetical protein
MKIVVLDGYATNPGDLSWERIERIGELTVYDRSPNADTEEILSRIDKADIVITNKTPLTREIFARSPKLRYVGVLATGYNVVDVDAAKEHGVTVTNEDHNMLLSFLCCKDFRVYAVGYPVFHFHRYCDHFRQKIRCLFGPNQRRGDNHRIPAVDPFCQFGGHLFDFFYALLCQFPVEVLSDTVVFCFSVPYQYESFRHAISFLPRF